MMPPEGFREIPNGARCRCIRLWTDGSGRYWCCNAGKAPKERKRRPVSRELRTLFAEWKASAAVYGRGDPFNTIETIEMYEGFEDKPADVIVAASILECLPDVRKALQEIKGLARKSVGFFIRLDALRDKEAWRKLIGEYFPVVDLTELPGDHIWIVGSASNAFGHGHVVAAGTLEGRWDNIVGNCKIVSKRIERAPAHGRTAIIACYGPSLADHLVPLIDERKDITRDLISVSGAHDYLIDHGLEPDFHVECDPRPHKANNIKKGLDGVRYLLGSMVHPLLMEKLQGENIALWHPSGEFNFRIINELEPDAFFIGGGGNVGLRSIPLFYELGYRSFSIFGMDCSFTEDGQQWAGAHAQKQNPTEQKIIQVNCGGRMFTTSPIYLTYANSFFDTVKVLPDAQFRVYGNSLLQAMSQMYMQQAQAA